MSDHSNRCRVCRGAGTWVTTNRIKICSACHGYGFVERSLCRRTFTVAGWDQGAA